MKGIMKSLDCNAFCIGVGKYQSEKFLEWIEVIARNYQFVSIDKEFVGIETSPPYISPEWAIEIETI